EDIGAALVVLVQGVVEAREHPGAVLKRRVRGDLLDALAVDPHLAPVVEAREELLARVGHERLGTGRRRRLCAPGALGGFPLGRDTHGVTSWKGMTAAGAAARAGLDRRRPRSGPANVGILARCAARGMALNTLTESGGSRANLAGHWANLLRDA